MIEHKKQTLFIGSYDNATKHGNFYYHRQGYISGNIETFSSSDADSVKLGEYEKVWQLDEAQKKFIEYALSSEDKKLRKKIVHYLKNSLDKQTVNMENLQHPYEKAITEYHQEEKQIMADYYLEQYKNDRMNYNAAAYTVMEQHDGYREYIYGVPVVEEDELKGFKMMKFDKRLDSRNIPYRENEGPYTDEKGEPVFLSVDEYYDLYKQHEEQDSRIGAGLKQAKEADAIERKVLNNSKLAKLRRMLVKKVDKFTQATGIEKVAKKIGINTNLEKKKIKKSLLRAEKDFSDIFFGRE